MWTIAAGSLREQGPHCHAPEKELESVPWGAASASERGQLSFVQQRQGFCPQGKAWVPTYPGQRERGAAAGSSCRLFPPFPCPREREEMLLYASVGS